MTASAQDQKLFWCSIAGANPCWCIQIHSVGHTGIAPMLSCSYGTP